MIGVRMAALLLSAASAAVARPEPPAAEARALSQRAAGQLRDLDQQGELWSVLLGRNDDSLRTTVRASASQVRRDARQARDLWRALTEPMAPELLAERAKALRSDLPEIEAIGSALEDLLLVAPDLDALRGASKQLSNARPHAAPEWVCLGDTVSSLAASEGGELAAATDSLALLAAAPSRYRLIARLGIARMANRTGQSARAAGIIEAIIAEQASSGAPMAEQILAADVADACNTAESPTLTGPRWLSLLGRSVGRDRSLVRRALPSRLGRMVPGDAENSPESIARSCRAATEGCAATAELMLMARSADRDAAAIAAWRLAECARAGGVEPQLLAATAETLQSFSQRFSSDPDAATLARTVVTLREAQGEAGPLADAFEVLAQCAADPQVAAMALANAATLRIELTLRGSPWSPRASELRTMADLASSPPARPDQLALAAAARLRAAIAERRSDLCELVKGAAAARGGATAAVQHLVDQSIELALVIGEPCADLSRPTGNWPPGVATALSDLALESFCSATRPPWIDQTVRTAPGEPLACAVLAQIRGDFPTAEVCYRQSLELDGGSALAQIGLAECLIQRGGDAVLIEAVSLARSAAERCEVDTPGWWRSSLVELEAIVAAGRGSAQVAAKLARVRAAHGLPECPALNDRFIRLSSP